MGLNYIPHQGRSFLKVTKSFVISGACSNKQTNKQNLVGQFQEFTDFAIAALLSADLFILETKIF